jgi:hypothetical protein
MSIFNQTDFTVRLQTINCCISTLTNQLLTKIKIGSKDVDCKLKELQVIQEMFEVLKCYNVNDETLSTGIIEIIEINPGDVVSIFIGGTLIGTGTAGGSNEANAMIGLANIINATQTVYTATFDPDYSKGAIRITGICNNLPITYTLVGDPGSEIIVTGLTGGVCINNCLTDTQVSSMMDYIFTKCGECIPLPGITYN